MLANLQKNNRSETFPISLFVLAPATLLYIKVYQYFRQADFEEI